MTVLVRPSLLASLDDTSPVRAQLDFAVIYLHVLVAVSIACLPCWQPAHSVTSLIKRRPAFSCQDGIFGRDTFFEYYHDARCHQSLDGNAPNPRQVEPPDRGTVVAEPMVGGLHHRYRRCA